MTIFSPGELTRIIKNEDIPSLTRVPGIGKNSRQINSELKDKISWLEPEQDKEDAGRWDWMLSKHWKRWVIRRQSPAGQFRRPCAVLIKNPLKQSW